MAEEVWLAEAEGTAVQRPCGRSMLGCSEAHGAAEQVRVSTMENGLAVSNIFKHISTL